MSRSRHLSSAPTSGASGPTARLPLLLNLLLLLGAGLLMLTLGTSLPLLCALAGTLAAAMLSRRPGGGLIWLSIIGGIAIFVSGTPLMGSPPRGLLLSAVMALYFLCWVQQLTASPLSQFSLANPFTLAFYGTLALAYLLLAARIFPLPHAVGVFLAAVFILASLALWELGRRSRLAQAAHAQGASLSDWVGRAFFVAAVLLGTFFLFRLPVPLVADGALAMAAELNPSARRSSSSPGDQLEDRSQTPSADRPSPEESGVADGSALGPEQHGRLPRRADLELGDLVRFHLHLPDEELAGQAPDRPLYLRAQVLSFYQDGAWTRADHIRDSIRDGEDGRADGWVTMGRAPADRAVRQQLYLYDYLPGRAIVGLPNLLAFKGPEIFRKSDDFFSLSQAGDVSYEIVSAPVHYAELMQQPKLEAGQAPPHYLAKAEGPAFRDVDDILLAPVLDVQMSLKKKLNYLRVLFERRFTYSHRIANLGDRGPLANFLFHERRGYCDFYAQAGAHMLRSLGVPSRVAYGYLGGIYDPTQRLYTFHERDRHAWTEALLKDHGWVIFDLVPSQRGAHRPARVQETSHTRAMLQERFSQPQEKQGDQAKRPPPGPAPANTTTARTWEEWFGGLWILRHLDLVLVISVVGLLCAYAVRRWRHRDDPKSDPAAAPATVRRDPPGYFRELCELFAKGGHPRAPGQTLREYFAILRHARLLEDEFDPILNYHYKVSYEDERRSKNLEREFRKQIRNYCFPR